MKAAFDTNILVYAEGVNGISRAEAAQSLIERIPVNTVMLPVQALGELFKVLVRKAGHSKRDAEAAMLRWMDTFPVIETSSGILKRAPYFASSHGLSMWDAVILASAAWAECRLLLSEDLQDGFTVDGVTIVNPFSSTPHPLLEQIMAAG